MLNIAQQSREWLTTYWYWVPYPSWLTAADTITMIAGTAEHHTQKPVIKWNPHHYLVIINYRYLCNIYDAVWRRPIQWRSNGEFGSWNPHSPLEPLTRFVQNQWKIFRVLGGTPELRSSHCALDPAGGSAPDPHCDPPPLQNLWPRQRAYFQRCREYENSNGDSHGYRYEDWNPIPTVAL